MIDFTFDIQRFAAGSQQFTSSGTFIVNGTSYSITLGSNSRATVSWDDAGNISLAATSGTVSQIRTTSGSTYPPITLNNSGSGTFNPAVGQKVTLGSTGRVFSLTGANSSSTISISRSNSNFNVTLDATPSSTTTGMAISFGDLVLTYTASLKLSVGWTVTSTGEITISNIQGCKVSYDDKIYELTTGLFTLKCSDDLAVSFGRSSCVFTSKYEDDSGNDVTVTYTYDRTNSLLSAEKTYTRDGTTYSTDWVWTDTFPTSFTATGLDLDTGGKLSQVHGITSGN
ncbi:MAG: hypothetical protein IJP42_04600, partial [Selenomonadaceae bacterium]|nr:hypothetical protein [Selenomonadaceae bacterium]